MKAPAHTQAPEAGVESGPLTLQSLFPAFGGAGFIYRFAAVPRSRQMGHVPSVLTGGEPGLTVIRHLGSFLLEVVSGILTWGLVRLSLVPDSASALTFLG